MFSLENWSKEFFQRATQPMTKEMSEIFLRMCMLEEKKSIDTTPVKGEFLFQMIEKRAEHIGLQISDPAKIFLMLLTRSPGSAVMYLYALRSKFTSVDMNTLADNFPIGFLPEKAMSEMWDKQKGHLNGESVDNCLDFLSFPKIAKNKP